MKGGHLKWGHYVVFLGVLYINKQTNKPAPYKLFKGITSKGFSYRAEKPLLNVSLENKGLLNLVLN